MSNFGLPQDVIDVLAENGYTIVKKLSKDDPFDPTEAGTRVAEPDDDFDDIELETPQACGLEECESCS